MMRWIYIFVIAVIFIRLAAMPQPDKIARQGIARKVSLEAHVPNSVAGILLRNRLYDTVFEVLVFTLAVLGVQHAFSKHETEAEIFHLQDSTMVILARIGAMISALLFLELSMRGHLVPGGGFAAGVAGGTAIGLVTMTGNVHGLHEFFERWHVATVEKGIVLLVLLLSVAFLLFSSLGFLFPALSGMVIPVLNVLIACKVALGSWTITLLFIRHRGLL